MCLQQDTPSLGHLRWEAHLQLALRHPGFRLVDSTQLPSLLLLSSDTPPPAPSKLHLELCQPNCEGAHKSGEKEPEEKKMPAVKRDPKMCKRKRNRKRKKGGYGTEEDGQESMRKGERRKRERLELRG